MKNIKETFNGILKHTSKNLKATSLFLQVTM